MDSSGSPEPVARKKQAEQLTPLGARLSAVGALVPPGSRVADVGSDHGLLARWLIERSVATHCWATERTAAQGRALDRAVDDLRPAVAVAWGDGLAPLGPALEALDVVVIAGMGGRTTLRILAEATVLPRRLVLQPQRHVARVRGWLRRQGWSVVQERLVAEREQRYQVIAAERGASSRWEVPGLEPADVEAAGPTLLRRGDPALLELWQRERARYQAAIEAAARAGNPAPVARSAFDQAQRIVDYLQSRRLPAESEERC